MSDKKDNLIKTALSEDRKKLGSFYNFSMDENKFKQIQKRSKKQLLRFAITGIAFGFFTEWLLGNSKIYDNIIKKTTMRRLSNYLTLYRCKEEIGLKNR